MGLRPIQISQDLLNNLDVPQIIDITDQLPVNPHYTWQQLTGGPRDLNAITSIALHHDAYPKSVTANLSDMELAKRIAEGHINLKKNEKNGDPGFPYHLWIRNGKVYQTNDLLTYTYGVASNNSYTVHICVSGDYFNYDTLTDADRKALLAAILTVIALLPNYKQVLGHKEYPDNATDCPGYDVNQIRSELQDILFKMKHANTEEATDELAFAIAREVYYLYDLMQKTKNSGERQWAKVNLLYLAPVMKEKGLIS